MVHRLAASARDFETKFAALLAAPRGPDEDVEAAAAAILSDVRARGAVADRLRVVSDRGKARGAGAAAVVPPEPGR